MRDEVTEFRKLCTTLALHRKTTIGLELDTSFLAEWPSDVRNRADFTALVSAAYLLWRERWKLDIGFLFGYRSDSAAREFDDLIYQLRTALLHADNVLANARLARWTQEACGRRDPASADEWLSCGAALMTALNAGMRVLCQTAARGREPSFRAAWQAKMSETPETAVTRVADDLGMWLSQWQRDGHVRRVTGRWNKYRLRAGEVGVDVLSSFAEQAPVSRMEALPCDYLDVLTELEVLGTGDAVPALHLAHAVAEITGVSGEAYLKRLKDVWLSLRA
jgi:hypothetical protein